MKYILIVLVLITVFIVGTTRVTKIKGFVTPHKKEATPVRFGVKDFPEYGISLIAPSDPSIALLVAKLTKSEAASIGDSYSVILKNTGSRAVVGYRIKWECVDATGGVSAMDTSNIVSWVFLYGEESDRLAALSGAKEIIKPSSSWLISLGSRARPLEGPLSTTEFNETGEAETIKGCSSVTAIADGIFFDDGIFIGPDTTRFFTEVKSQMDARHEILQGVQDDLKAGKNAGEIFRGLEKIRDQENIRLGENPTPDEFRTYFRNLFAQDVLGSKELYGADKALDEVQHLLSKPWVNLRKL